jgi:imidazoleglycerol-phosphate dehydratase
MEISKKNRHGKIARTTRETDIRLEVTIDGEGKSAISTGIPFFDHMLELFAKHGFFDLVIECKGDIEVDYHHSFEDLGLALGDAIKTALGTKEGIKRYGSFLLPMDEALARVAIDLSGRPYLVYNVELQRDNINGIDVQLFEEFFYALSVRAGINLHIDLIRGKEVHHCIEGVFKAFARALDDATTIDPRINGVMSTKGLLD